MFAYFQTYLRSLSKKDENRQHSNHYNNKTHEKSLGNLNHSLYTHNARSAVNLRGKANNNNTLNLDKFDEINLNNQNKVNNSKNNSQAYHHLNRRFLNYSQNDNVQGDVMNTDLLTFYNGNIVRQSNLETERIPKNSQHQNQIYNNFIKNTETTTNNYKIASSNMNNLNQLNLIKEQNQDSDNTQMTVINEGQAQFHQKTVENKSHQYYSGANKSNTNSTHKVAHKSNFTLSKQRPYQESYQPFQKTVKQEVYYKNVESKNVSIQNQSNINITGNYSMSYYKQHPDSVRSSKQLPQYQPQQLQQYNNSKKQIQQSVKSEQNKLIVSYKEQEDTNICKFNDTSISKLETKRVPLISQGIQSPKVLQQQQNINISSTNIVHGQFVKQSSEEYNNMKTTEEDVYMQYLNQGYSPTNQKSYGTQIQEQRQTVSLLKTVVQDSFQYDAPDTSQAIKQYQDQINFSRLAQRQNQVPTPNQLLNNVKFSTNDSSPYNIANSNATTHRNVKSSMIIQMGGTNSQAQTQRNNIVEYEQDQKKTMLVNPNIKVLNQQKSKQVEQQQFNSKSFKSPTNYQSNQVHPSNSKGRNNNNQNNFIENSNSTQKTKKLFHSLSKEGTHGTMLNKEFTYESERSSIFHENINNNNMDQTNRNNLMYNQEETKKQPLDIQDIIQQIPRNESSRSFKKPLEIPSLQLVNQGGVFNYYEQNNLQENPSKLLQQHLELNMRMQNMGAINESLFLKNQFLRCVDLRNNNLKRLPDSICNLNILWKLRLDFNLLTELPKDLGRLERLEVLTVSNNQLKFLPESLYKLSDKLGMLQLNDNQIKNISTHISRLKKLRVLLLHNNCLKTLPSDIHILRELQELSSEWFIYMNPPQNKILKDERGILMIKEFQKFCKQMSEINDNKSLQCRFVHFLAYFNKLPSIEQLGSMNSYSKGRSILHYICLYGNLHLLRDVLKSCPQIDLNICDQDGTTPLILAFKNKQTAIIQELLKYSALNINKGSSKYGYPLHIAIKNHDFKIVLKMLQPQYVININAKDYDQNNALHFLMAHFSYDSKACAKVGAILLRKGIEPNAMNKSEFTPLHIAIKSFQNKSLRFALEYNHYLKKKYEKELCPFEEIQDRRKSSINPFGLGGFMNNQQVTFKDTILSQLKPFDFNAQGKNGWTPLHFAVFNNNLIAVELLLHAQQHYEPINIFQRDNEGKYAQELCPFNSAIYKMIIKRQLHCIQLMSTHNEQLGQTGVMDQKDQQPRQLLHNHLNHYLMRKRLRGHKTIVNIGSNSNLLIQNGVSQIQRETCDEAPYKPNSGYNQLKRANSNGMLLMQKQLEQMEIMSYGRQNQHHKNVKMFANGKVKVDVKNLNFGAQEENSSDQDDSRSNNSTTERVQNVQQNLKVAFTRKMSNKSTLDFISISGKSALSNNHQRDLKHQKYEDKSSSSGGAMRSQEESLNNQIRQSIMKQNNLEKSHNVIKSSKLQNSKTEKNLMNNHRSFMQQFSGEINLGNLKNANFALYDSKEGTKNYDMKGHPRIQQQQAVFPSKYENNNEDDAEFEDMERFFKQEDKEYNQKTIQDIHIDEDYDHVSPTRFMSHAVNFDTDIGIDHELENLHNKSKSNNSDQSSDSTIQDEIDDNLGSLLLSKQLSDQVSYQQTEVINNSLAFNKHPNLNRFPVKQVKSLQSSQQRVELESGEDEKTYNDSSLLSRDQIMLQSLDNKKIQKNINHRYENMDINSQQNYEEEGDDFCDAQDEEAEAGALGLIANKINKFENHNNIDNNDTKVNEREALQQFIIDMKTQKDKMRKRLQVQKQNQVATIQNVEFKDRHVDNPFSYVKDIYDHEDDKANIATTGMYLNNIDEGTVLDTTDIQNQNFGGFHFDQGSLLIDDSKTKFHEDYQQISDRNVKPKANIFLINEIITPSSQNINSVLSRKSIIDQNKQFNMESTNNGLLKLADLNRDCKMFESAIEQPQKITLDTCIQLLNDESKALSLKYQIFYTYVYQGGKELDYKKLKNLYDKLEDNSFNAIIKVDVSYMMSVSKNKEFIPQLDKAIKTYREEFSKSGTINISRLNIKSPEPTLDIKKIQSSQDLQISVTKSTSRYNQSNCKKLIIYETANAFDILMQDAMLQSKQMMEQCNNRIHLERERSREKLKIKHINSQQKLQTSNSLFFDSHSKMTAQQTTKFNQSQVGKLVKIHVQNLKGEYYNQSVISEVDAPQELLIQRIHKSPSNQSITNLKHVYSQKHIINLDQRRNQDDDSLQQAHSKIQRDAKVGSKQIDFTQQIYNNNIQQEYDSVLSNSQTVEQNLSGPGQLVKKQTFTPKGNTGQVILSFQRQKQLSKANLLIEPQSPIKEYDSYVPYYRVNLQNEENYNETILNPPLRQPQQIFEPLNHSRLQDESKTAISQSQTYQRFGMQKSGQLLSQSASVQNISLGFTNSNNASTSSLTQNIKSANNIANIIHTTIQDIQKQRELTNQMMTNNESRNVIYSNNNSNNVNEVQHVKVVHNQKQNAFSIKQKELSQQIKYNLQKKPQNSTSQNYLNSNRMLANASSMLHKGSNNVSSINESNTTDIYTKRGQSNNQYQKMNQKNNHQVNKTNLNSHSHQPYQNLHQASNKKQSKMALNKLSPDKMTRLQQQQDISLERVDERLRNNLGSNNSTKEVQILQSKQTNKTTSGYQQQKNSNNNQTQQSLQYVKYQQRQQNLQNSNSQNTKTINNSVVTQQRYQGVKQVKYNLSIDSNSQKNIKKSTSTTKLTSDTTIQI